ncbi:MAG: hypothetical protein U0519_02115 [Candidatus Gracilibacteria bacterium]
MSPATIRNDMAALEKEEYIFQPHTSAGRVPTDKGFTGPTGTNLPTSTLNAHWHSDPAPAPERVCHRTGKREDLRKCLTAFTRNTQCELCNTSGQRRTFYLGLSNVLRQPEFLNDTVRASQVIEVLERHDHFVTLLKKLNVNNTIQIFIGKENDALAPNSKLQPHGNKIRNQRISGLY